MAFLKKLHETKIWGHIPILFQSCHKEVQESFNLDFVNDTVTQWMWDLNIFNLSVSPGIWDALFERFRGWLGVHILTWSFCRLNQSKCETHSLPPRKFLQPVTIPSIYKNISTKTLFRMAQKSGHQSHKDHINSPGHWRLLK